MYIPTYLFRNSSFCRRVFEDVSHNRVEDILRKITPHIDTKKKILDIGSGTGMISHRLKSEGYLIKCVDIGNGSIYDDTDPTIYDGVKLPFKSNSFDTAFLITVLHHVPEPQAVLTEAKRVAKQVIVMEDLVRSPIQRYMTYMMDSIVNLEFFSHPHSNKTDREWKSLFKSLDLSVSHFSFHNYWGIFISGLYVLDHLDISAKTNLK